jgi:Tol biopolymer transport system component
VRRFSITVLLLALAVAGAPVVSARAALYTPPELVSAVGSLQSDSAYQPDISADGRYVVFTGSFNGVIGIYRKDLLTGELELVAGANSSEPALNAPDASSPSVSADGRYVSFNSTAGLDPGAPVAVGCSNVYVRDMTIPAQSPGAYTLASALDGSEQSIVYSSCAEGTGSAVADRVALSGDGRQVAFTVSAESNLTSGVGGPEQTPPYQVAVRDLGTQRTTLVSQTMVSLGSTPQPVSGGATIPEPGSTASISADGSTVAWMGIEIPTQTPAAAAPVPGGDAPNTYPAQYAEPLWRRIADGPSAPTRRITGGDDPLGCGGGCPGPLDTFFNTNVGLSGPGPEFGTYVAFDSALPPPDAVTPRLSADGQEVALLSTQPSTGHDPANPQGAIFDLSANLMVVNMASGLSRVQAFTPVTEWADDNFHNPATTGTIGDLAISPDGTRVAFTTERVVFPQSPPALVTPPLDQAVNTQLYVADLAAGTLSLVSYGYEGGPANKGVSAPSFSSNGLSLAFASGATNLVYGAYNSGGSNVFATSELSSTPVAALSAISALPPAPAIAPGWELQTTVRRRSNGSVLLFVTVPGAGSLKATATAAVPVKATAKSGTASDKRASGKARATRGSKTKAHDAARAKSKLRTIVRSRTVASAKGVTAGPGLVALPITAQTAYRSLVRARNGLFATITVRFLAAGKRTLSDTVQVDFHATSPAKKPKRSTKAAGR